MKQIIDNDLLGRRKLKKGKSKEEEEEEKTEEKRRKFLEQMRPPNVWNFFEQGDQTPHILRAEANPHKCYVDGRIESLFSDITTIGFHLTKHDEISWKKLVDHTLEIFKAEYKQEQEEIAKEQGGGDKTTTAATAKK